MQQHHRNNLLIIYQAALNSVNGRERVKTYLSNNPITGPIYLIATGKAAASMAAGACDVLGKQIINGLVIIKQGYHYPVLSGSLPLTLIEAGHPYPDANSIKAGRMLLESIDVTPKDAHLLFLISGGTSALVEVLPAGVGLADIEKINRWLLGSGNSIGEINTVRKAVSCIKGGRLATILAGRQTTQLLISDVPGDDPATIGSGLLVADYDSTISVQHLKLPGWISEIIKKTEPKPAQGDPCFKNIHTQIIATAADARHSAAVHAKKLGYEVFVHDELITDDCHIAVRHITEVLKSGPAGLHIWSAEVTLQLPDHPGQGGRCQHLALIVAKEINDRDDIFLLAAGTDGSDGPGDDAGAIVDGGTITRGRESGLSIDDCLKSASSNYFLAESGDLINTGPTGTNVMDLVLGLKV